MIGGKSPYIRGTSERVRKILRKYDIVLSNKPSNTLFNQFNNLKATIIKSTLSISLAVIIVKIFILARHANNFQKE